MSCHCKSECKSKRCACVKAGVSCDDCHCESCKNPFNDLKNSESLTDCARSNIVKFKSLSEKKLKQKYELPCSCEEVALENLISDYQCQECDGIYFYSFCLDEVVYEDAAWHCKKCNTCQEDSEWHCESCNKCTYGLSLECENCGAASPYML